MNEEYPMLLPPGSLNF